MTTSNKQKAARGEWWIHDGKISIRHDQPHEQVEDYNNNFR